MSDDSRMSGSRRNITISMSEEYAQVLDMLVKDHQKRHVFQTALDTFLAQIAQLRSEGVPLLSALKIENGDASYVLYFYTEQWADIDALVTEMRVNSGVVVYTLITNMLQSIIDGLTPEEYALLEPFRQVTKKVLASYEDKAMGELKGAGKKA